MITTVYEKFQGFFSGDIRSSKAKKNIAWSLFLKGTGILVSVLIVPLTLNYLSAYEYGVWLTLSSILTWINFLDIGLVNGLRNRLAECIARNDMEMGRIYISTTFFLLALILIGCFALFLIIQPFISWSEILNTDPGLVDNLNLIIALAFAFFALSLVFKLVGIILIADQRPAANDLIFLLGSVLSLLVLFILTRTTQGSLSIVILTFTALPAVVLIFSYFVLFAAKYRNLKPSIKKIRFEYSRDLMGLGVQFFIMQISGIIIFSSSNIVISQILGPEQVTPYNIVYKYFSIVTLFFGIIITPMWTATTDAFVKGDISWISKAVKNLLKIWMAMSAGIFIMVLCSEIVYSVWIGHTVKIPYQLTLLMGLYSVLLTWSVCFSTFLFGIGKLRLQLLNLLVMSVLFIPLAVWLIKAIGIYGALVALILVNVPAAVLNPLQLKLILNRRAKGIWLK